MNRRPEERFAEELLRRVLGIQVSHRDSGMPERMVDVLFRLPDGREGALEVTTIGQSEALERESIAAKTEWIVPQATWSWVIHVGDGVLIRDLKKYLPILVIACEKQGVSDPHSASPGKREREAFEWFFESNISMHGFPETNRPGAIDVLPNGGGGAVYENLDELPEWLEGRLKDPDLARKIAKLEKTGRQELHLFLRVHDTAMPFSLYHPLAWDDYIPSRELEPPGRLTGLWLVPTWKNPILWWSATDGWARTEAD